MTTIEFRGKVLVLFLELLDTIYIDRVSIEKFKVLSYSWIQYIQRLGFFFLFEVGGNIIEVFISMLE